MRVVDQGVRLAAQEPGTRAHGQVGLRDVPVGEPGDRAVAGPAGQGQPCGGEGPGGCASQNQGAALVSGQRIGAQAGGKGGDGRIGHIGEVALGGQGAP